MKNYEETLMFLRNAVKAYDEIENIDALNAPLEDVKDKHKFWAIKSDIIFWAVSYIHDLEGKDKEDDI